MTHLGLGNFFRAHQAWYTDRASDAQAWGIAAFTGRSRGLTDELTAQDGLYTLVTRGSDADRFDVIGSVSRAYGANDHDAWLRHLANPEVRVVTLTITEAGYLCGADGALESDRPTVRADIETLRRDPTAPVYTAPARLVAGIAARRRADGGPLALVPCDNVTGNGTVVARVLRELAEQVDSGLAAWLAESVSTVATMVDRITPGTQSNDLRTVAQATGWSDRAPVVTEPFSEWVLSGGFPGGRPRWEEAGAVVTDDVTPFEERKLWLLNGAHSLLAYAGSARGHTTVAGAFGDESCREWVEEWWDEASPHLRFDAADVTYRAVLADRFANSRIRHRLDQIAADGTHKLRIRILPVLRRERAAGRVPQSATRVLAAWICHLRGLGSPVVDELGAAIVPLAGGSVPDAVRRVLDALDQTLGADREVVAAVIAHVDRFERRGGARHL